MKVIDINTNKCCNITVGLELRSGDRCPSNFRISLENVYFISIYLSIEKNYKKLNYMH